MFAGGACLPHCRLFSSILGLYPRDTSSTPPPPMTTKNVSTHCQKTSWGHIATLQTTALEQWFSTVSADQNHMKSFVETAIAGPTQTVRDSVGWGSCLRINISSKFSDDADVARPRTRFGKLLVDEYSTKSRWNKIPILHDFLGFTEPLNRLYLNHSNPMRPAEQIFIDLSADEKIAA